jgi:hypothetical protein
VIAKLNTKVFISSWEATARSYGILIMVGNVGNIACYTIRILVGKDVTLPQVTAKSDPPRHPGNSQC